MKLRFCHLLLPALLVLSFTLSVEVGAKTNARPNLMSVTKTDYFEQSPESILKSLGKPTEKAETWKHNKWDYKQGAATLTLFWNNKGDELEKISYDAGSALKKKPINPDHLAKLKSGTTTITQAISLLGTPNDMLLKSRTQEIHYTYENNVLRLFFRERTLVDFALY